MDRQCLMTDTKELIHYLLERSPVVIDKELARLLGGDEHTGGEPIRNLVSIETIEKAGEILDSRVLFRPFEGVYPTTVDERGRMQFPSEFRYIFDLDPLLTIGKKDGMLSLSLCPRNLSGESPTLRPEVSLDSYNRFLIPRYLRDIVGIGRKAILIGDYNQVVISDEVKFREFITNKL